MGKTEHPTTSALLHNCFISILVIAVITFFGSSIIGVKGMYGHEILFSPNYFMIILFILGFVGSFVQYFMTTSYKYADATILVTLRFIAIPLAAVFGYIIWDEVPTQNQIIGTVFILVSCLFITLREMKINKNN